MRRLLMLLVGLAMLFTLACEKSDDKIDKKVENSVITDKKSDKKLGEKSD